MTLWEKLKTTISAKLNTILNASADPEEKLNYADEQFRDEIVTMENALAQVKTGRQIAATKRDGVLAQIKTLEQNAQVAVNNNRDDLARTLLARKIGLQANVDTLNATIDNLDKQIAQVQMNFDALTSQYNEFKAQKASAVGRYKAAKAESQAYGLAKGVGTRIDGIKGEIANAMDATDDLEAKASALRDVSALGPTFDGTYKDSVTLEVEKLQSGASVDDELAKLKAKTPQTQTAKTSG